MSKALHIGLTGPFASGCTTIAGILQRSSDGFKVISLSDLVKETWLDENNGAKISRARRRDLQDMGNKLRERSGDPAILAKESVKRASTEMDSGCSIVFDSIRNVAEVEYLRQAFYDFYLMGVCCPEISRWGRAQREYEERGCKYADFKADEKRDQNEEGNSLGQQVALCMHDADVLIVNEDHPMKEAVTAFETILKGKLDDYIGLFRGDLRPPTERESYMSIAYNASLMSKCFKRQVGAVIIDDNGIVVGTGYNKNPEPLKACHEEFGECYRNTYIGNQMRELPNCPICKGGLPEKFVPPYICPQCKKDLYEILFRDRAMSKCTALHAEEMAIMNAGARNLRSCTIYTTTYPCFTCAQKILHAGIKNIIYVESYADLDSMKLFEIAIKSGRIALEKFEGIKARAYHRLFGPWRKHIEDQIMTARGA
jgi:deoxycytidylate deaminase